MRKSGVWRETLRFGLMMGVRRNLATAHFAMFDRMWRFFRDDFVDRDLQLIAASECFHSFDLASTAHRLCRLHLENGNEELAKKIAKTAYFEMTKRVGNRSGYVLWQLFADPTLKFFRLPQSATSRLIQQYRLMKSAAEIADGKKSKIRVFIAEEIRPKASPVIRSLLEDATALALRCSEPQDRLLALAMCILLITEPPNWNITKTDRENPESNTFTNTIPWYIVHPSTSIGRQIARSVSNGLRVGTNSISPEDILLAWRIFYTDKVTSNRQLQWERFLKQACLRRTSISEEDWFLVWVRVSAMCEKWVSTNDSLISS